MLQANFYYFIFCVSYTLCVSVRMTDLKIDKACILTNSLLPLIVRLSSFHQVCEDNDVRKKMWHSVMHHNIVHKERARSRLPSLHDVGICALGALQDGLVVEKVNKIVPLSV